MNLKLIKSKLNAFGYILKGQGGPSFAQVGEDRIVNYLFATRGITKPSYIDIGANHPVAGNNTYFFYHRGANGVCIEPEPRLYKKLLRTRKKDICLNVGIGLDDVAEMDFFIYLQNSGWNTFSKEEAELRKKEGHSYSKVLKIPVRNINQIIRDTLGAPPDLMSIDVEGLDFDILRSLDYEQYAPMVLIVETIRFGDTSKAMKRKDIIDFMKERGYSVYADTYVNTIFLRENHP